MTAYDTFRDTRHFASLDGLRFLCITAVIWHHSPLIGLATPGFILPARGFVGVDFFFVLSGFLITTLLLREESEHGRFSLPAFYWRRALRILPIYFFVVTLVGSYYVFVKGDADAGALLPWYYLFLANFLVTDIPLLAPTWSLAVEEQYYLIWPALLLLLPRRHVLPVLLVLIALNVIIISGGFAWTGLTAPHFGPLRLALPNATYAPILIGSGLAMILHQPNGFAALNATLGHRLAAPLGLAGLVAALALLPQDLRGWPNLMIHLIMAATLTALVVREDNALAPILRLRPIARIGQISYGIYLYHLIALHIAGMILPRFGIDSGWATFFLYYAISIAIAELSFRTLERFFMRFRHRPRFTQYSPPEGPRTPRKA